MRWWLVFSSHNLCLDWWYHIRGGSVGTIVEKNPPVSCLCIQHQREIAHGNMSGILQKKDFHKWCQQLYRGPPTGRLLDSPRVMGYRWHATPLPHFSHLWHKNPMLNTACITYYWVFSISLRPCVRPTALSVCFWSRPPFVNTNDHPSWFIV